MAAPTDTKRKAFKKVLKFSNKSSTGQIDIEFNADGRLSISGEVRERGRYGSESAGQCQDTMLELFPESKRLYEIWERWHLNDMNAGCEHQRKEWNTTKKVTIYTHKLTYEGSTAKREVLRNAEKELLAGKTVKLTPSEIEIANLEYTVKNHQPTPPSMLYKLDSEEVKSVGWVHENEHPEGILAKPCLVCGYKYGTAWKFEEVPTEILDELRAM